ncbi:MAG: hypothetical protein WA635_11670, partial [Gallionella sp.]
IRGGENSYVVIAREQAAANMTADKASPTQEKNFALFNHLLVIPIVEPQVYARASPGFTREIVCRPL